MNVRRFQARSSREALSLARQALGDDAVVLSMKPCPEGIELLALAADGLHEVERLAAPAVTVAPPAAATPAEPPPAMSTLSFKDYVRERMLKRQRSESAGEAAPSEALPLRAQAAAAAPVAAPAPRSAGRAEARTPAPQAEPLPLRAREAAEGDTAGPAPAARRVAEPAQAEPKAVPPASIADVIAWPDAAPIADLRPAVAAGEPPAEPARASAPAPLAEPASPPISLVAPPPPSPRGLASPRLDAAHDAPRDHAELLSELRAMKGLIEDRFGALAFMEKLQREPGQARLTQKLLDSGFSAALTRHLLEHLDPAAGDELAWAGRVLERNLLTAEHEAPLEDQGGVYALIGATGVGKTTTTAKIAAAFATRHGAADLGLITLDAYRIAAHEQLRAYGRILGVPVHTAHDRATLEDLLDLLSAKKMVLIDTAGMGQRDTRTRELLETVAHASIGKLLVVNSAAQGETIEDVMFSYRAGQCAGVVLSKTDEAIKLGPALDAVIRHRMKVVGVANGQRVPEDWHRMSAQALVHRALRAAASAPFRLDASDASLVCAGARRMPAASALAMPA